MVRSHKLFFFLTILFFSSCANKGLKLSIDAKDWYQYSPPSNESPYHTVYLIGDVGGAKEGKSTIPLIELKKQLKTDNRSDQATDVVFLGDNIYPVGMPPIDHEDRPLAEHRLNVQLEAVRQFEGNITFVPGNHDWYTYGRAGLKRQESYIEDYLGKYGQGFTDFFRPSDGCGNIDVMKIATDIALVSIDSHWFLTEKESEYDYSDCRIKSRPQFASAFQDSLNALRGQKVLLTMHHPLFTVGKHGGNYSMGSILMPSTNYKSFLKIPAPAAGLALKYIRPKLSEQDSKSHAYVDLRNTLIPSIEQHRNTIVAAGHEHTLQHHHRNGIDYIVSGSGSKEGEVAMSSITRFAYGKYGYAVLDYYTDEIWLSFYAQDESDTFTLVYRSQLR